MRKAEKIAARNGDAARLEQGVAPEKIQRKNSIFSEKRIQDAPIQNLLEIVGA